MTEYATISGLTQAVAALRALPAELGSHNGGPLRRALFRGAVLIRDEAIARVPRATGNLANQIFIYRDRNPRASTGAAERFIIGVRSGKGSRVFKVRTRGRFAGRSQYRRTSDAYYWRFVEFGTEKMPARPFLRPAFENKKRDVVDEFDIQLKRGVASAARKARKASGA